MNTSPMNQSILEILTCQNCFKRATAPIYNCVKGHIICIDCGNGNLSCIICKSMFVARNYALEKITELVEYPCPNINKGCKECFKRSDIDDHSTVCSFREYSCILGDVKKTCRWRGSRHELTRHALVYHGRKAWKGVDRVNMWSASDPDYEIHFISALGHMFYMHRKLVRSETGHIMYWVFQYVGKSEDVIQFYYKVHFTTDEYANRSIMCRELCYDDVKDIDEMIESGYCVAMPLSVLETYKNRNGYVCYGVKIEPVL